MFKFFSFFFYSFHGNNVRRPCHVLWFKNTSMRLEAPLLWGHMVQNSTLCRQLVLRMAWKPSLRRCIQKPTLFHLVSYYTALFISAPFSHISVAHTTICIDRKTYSFCIVATQYFTVWIYITFYSSSLMLEVKAFLTSC